MRKHSIIRYKLYFTLIILLIYSLGRAIPLPGVDVESYTEVSLDAESLLLQVMGGDRFRYSLFALGITPYMFGSLLVSMLLQAWKSATKETPRATTNSKLTMLVAMMIAIPMAYLRTQQLEYIVSEYLVIYQVANFIAMVAGSFLIIFLMSRNKKYGLGNQTALFLVNILSGIVTNIKKADSQDIIIALAMGLPLVVLMVIMENAEFRIPVQRVSVYSEYAEDTYIAFKLNPIGIMPVMFAMTFFMIPSTVVNLLYRSFPNNPGVVWWKTELVMTRPLGIVIYLLILYVLTIVFSLLFLGPSDLAEQMLKAGDSLVDIRAGRKTKGYLIRRLLVISIFSATIMSVWVGIPLLLKMYGIIGDAGAALPTTIMMLTGMWCNLYQEYVAVRSFDEYEEFI